MSEYKFWKTQPVLKFDEKPVGEIQEGPEMMDLNQVDKEPSPLIDGFEWVTMDMLNEEDVDEVFALLSGHYVEDDQAMFRFNYSREFLKCYAFLLGSRIFVRTDFNIRPLALKMNLGIVC